MVIAVKDLIPLKGIPYTLLEDELEILLDKKIIWEKLGLVFPLKDLGKDMFLTYIPNYDASLEREGYTYICVPKEYLFKVQNLLDKKEIQ